MLLVLISIIVNTLHLHLTNVIGILYKILQKNKHNNKLKVFACGQYVIVPLVNIPLFSTLCILAEQVYSQWQEVDMTGAMVFASHIRRRAMDLSTPLLVQDNFIVYKTLPLEPNIAGFVLPFTPLVSLSHFKCIMVTKNIMY